MSKNFFAALDDDDDEPVVKAPQPKAAPKASAATDAAAKEKRRPNNNDRNTKQGRGGRTAPRDGKRAYDRRSGTGRGKEIKKDGGGARNWGSDKNEARKAEGTVADGETTTKPPREDRRKNNYDNNDAAANANATTAEPVVEEVDNTISFEEFMQKKTLPKSDAFAPKAARSDAADDFAKVAPKVAVEENFLVMGAGKAQRSRDKTKEKKVIATGFRVAPSDASLADRRDDDRTSGRGGRGGRGDGRGRGRGGRVGRGGGSGRGGRGGRGGGRGGRGAPINTMDANAFPSL